jgi:hypothetical protein
MRTLRIPLLAGFAVLLGATVAWPCGLPLPTEPLKLPAGITRSVIRGSLLHAISSNGQLLTVNLMKNTVQEVGRFSSRLSPILDVAGDQACVVGAKSIYLVDLKSGKILHTRDSADEVQDAGFIREQRVWFVAGAKLSIVDMAGDKVLNKIDLGKAPREACRGVVTGEGASRRILIPIQEEKAILAVIDPEKGEVIERIPLPGMPMVGIHAAGDVQVFGDRAYVVCWRFSYGVWTERIGCVDLKEKKFTALKRSSPIMGSRWLAAGADGKVFLTGADGTDQYDAKGKWLGSVFAKEGELLGVWRGQALLVKDKELRRQDLARVTAKTE